MVLDFTILVVCFALYKLKICNCIRLCLCYMTVLLHCRLCLSYLSELLVFCWVFHFYVPYQIVSIESSSVADTWWNAHIADITSGYWTAFVFQFIIFPQCRHFSRTFRSQIVLSVGIKQRIGLRLLLNKADTLRLDQDSPSQYLRRR